MEDKSEKPKRSSRSVEFDAEKLREAIEDYGGKDLSLRSHFRRMREEGLTVTEGTLYKATRSEPIDRPYAMKIARHLGVDLDSLIEPDIPLPDDARSKLADSSFSDPDDVGVPKWRSVTSSPPRDENPYAKLAAYDESNAINFYGRERETKRLVSWCRESLVGKDRRPILVVGASGSGKTSLMRSGVIPALQAPAAELQQRIDFSDQIVVAPIYINFDPLAFGDESEFADHIAAQLNEEKLGSFHGPRSGQSMAGLRIRLRDAMEESTRGAVAGIAEALWQENREIAIALFVDGFHNVASHPSAPLSRWIYSIVKAVRTSESPGCCLLARQLNVGDQLGFDDVALPDDLKSTNCRVYRQPRITEEFLREIIAKPFDRAGIPLSNEEIDNIVDWAFTIEDELYREAPLASSLRSNSIPARRSPLSVISLYLHELFKHRSKPIDAVADFKAEARSGDADSVAKSGSLMLNGTDVESKLSRGEIGWERGRTRTHAANLPPVEVIDLLATRVWGMVDSGKAKDKDGNWKVEELQKLDTYFALMLTGSKLPGDDRTTLGLGYFPEPAFSKTREDLERAVAAGIVLKTINGYQFSHLAIPESWSYCKAWREFRNIGPFRSGDELLLQIDALCNFPIKHELGNSSESIASDRETDRRGADQLSFEQATAILAVLSPASGLIHGCTPLSRAMKTCLLSVANHLNRVRYAPAPEIEGNLLDEDTRIVSIANALKEPLATSTKGGILLHLLAAYDFAETMGPSEDFLSDFYRALKWCDGETAGGDNNGLQQLSDGISIGNGIASHPNSEGRRPLHFAAWTSGRKTVEALLDSGASAWELEGVESGQAWSPVAVACYANNHAVLPDMLRSEELEFESDTMRERFLFAVGAAIANDSVDSLSVMLSEARAITSSDDFENLVKDCNLLFKIASYDAYRCGRWLTSSPQFWQSALQREFKSYRDLLQRDDESTGKAERKHISRLLRDQPFQAIHAAAEYSDVRLLSLLINNIARASTDLRADLFDDYGLDVHKICNLQDSRGMTPIMRAAKAGKLAAVKFLLKYGDLELRCKKGFTALHYACDPSFDEAESSQVKNAQEDWISGFADPQIRERPMVKRLIIEELVEDVPERLLTTGTRSVARMREYTLTDTIEATEDVPGGRNGTGRQKTVDAPMFVLSKKDELLFRQIFFTYFVDEKAARDDEWLSKQLKSVLSSDGTTLISLLCEEKIEIEDFVRVLSFLPKSFIDSEFQSQPDRSSQEPDKPRKSPLRELIRNSWFAGIDEIERRLGDVGKQRILTAFLDERDLAGRTRLHAAFLRDDKEAIAKWLDILGNSSQALAACDVFGRIPSDLHCNLAEFEPAFLRKLPTKDDTRHPSRAPMESWDERWNWKVVSLEELGSGLDCRAAFSDVSDEESLRKRLFWQWENRFRYIAADLSSENPREESELVDSKGGASGFYESSLSGLFVSEISVCKPKFFTGDVAVVRVRFSRSNTDVSEFEQERENSDVQATIGDLPPVAYRILCEDRVLCLDGTSSPIHFVRSKAFALPDPDSGTAIADYKDFLSFFCFAVHGPDSDGPFLIVESSSQTELVQRGIDESSRSVIGRFSRPVLAVPGSIGEDGTRKTVPSGVTFSAIVWYSHALFEAEFFVQTDGQISMLDEEPITDGLLVHDHSWFA